MLGLKLGEGLSRFAQLHLFRLEGFLLAVYFCERIIYFLAYHLNRAESLRTGCLGVSKASFVLADDSLKLVTICLLVMDSFEGRATCIPQLLKSSFGSLLQLIAFFLLGSGGIVLGTGAGRLQIRDVSHDGVAFV
jgi:hypothetical protein